VRIVNKAMLVGMLLISLIIPAISADSDTMVSNDLGSSQPYILIFMQQGNGNFILLSPYGSYQVERNEEVNFTVIYIWIKSEVTKQSIQNSEQLYKKYEKDILKAIEILLGNKDISKLDSTPSSYPPGNWRVYINTSTWSNISLGEGDQHDLDWLEIGNLLIGSALPYKQLDPYTPSDPVGSTFDITAEWNGVGVLRSLEIEDIAIVPEPATFIMTATGFLIIVGLLYRRKKEL